MKDSGRVAEDGDTREARILKSILRARRADTAAAKQRVKIIGFAWIQSKSPRGIKVAAE